jgi:uracil-DNA glycosylase
LDKNEDVKRLYSQAFAVSSPEDWDHKGQRVEFKCPYAQVCSVDQEKEAMWSPALGDPDNKVMVVAEAPSTAEGGGLHIGGLTRDWKENEKGGVGDFLAFVKRRFRANPHFTDVMKCGVARQTRERKRVFELREKNCVENYLLEEIRIVAPEVILCVGKTASRVLKELQNKRKISNSIKLVELLHYSAQANLPVTIKDKVNIIWPIQLGDGGNRSADLSYLNRKASSKVLDSILAGQPEQADIGALQA